MCQIARLAGIPAFEVAVAVPPPFSFFFFMVGWCVRARGCVTMHKCPRVHAHKHTKKNTLIMMRHHFSESTRMVLCANAPAAGVARDTFVLVVVIKVVVVVVVVVDVVVVVVVVVVAVVVVVDVVVVSVVVVVVVCSHVSRRWSFAPRMYLLHHHNQTCMFNSKFIKRPVRGQNNHQPGMPRLRPCP